MKRHKLLRRTAGIILLLFILANVMAYRHAYKFTHFDSDLTSKTKTPQSLSISEKLMTLFWGVNNPRPENKKSPAPPFETIRLRSNKSIECWLIRKDAAAGTVILFHGYGGEKSSMLDKAAVFHDLGYTTLLVDFMGSGGSEGNQTTIGYYESEQVKTAFDFIQRNGEKNIILFSTSLGATAIMKAQQDHALPARSIILECPFGSLLETVSARFSNMKVPAFPMAHLLVFWGGVQNGFNGFNHNPEKYASHITVPTLLLYGEKDEKVSRRETDRIFNNLQGKKQLITYPLARHENYLNDYRDQWTSDIKNFLSKNL